LAPGRFEATAPSAALAPGTSAVRRNGIEVLELPAGAEWARPLRGNPRDVTFVSLHACASSSTVIEVGGARLGVTASASDGCLQLMYDDSTLGALQWKGLGLVLRMESYGGRMLAPLPVLTLRIDPEAGMWDVYSGARLLAHGLPLIAANRADRRIILKAGTDGAWISGVVLADDNPLYDDANENGIDDRFEYQQRGGPLPSGAIVERGLVADQWRSAQRGGGAPILVFRRPLPDRALAGGQ
jgi:hypothetical protein